MHDLPENVMGELEDRERVVRLEERVNMIHALVGEIRTEQKLMAASISGASGGFRMLMLVGGLVGLAGALRGVISMVAGWIQHNH